MWFKRKGTSDRTPNHVLSTPHAGTVAKLEAAICRNRTTPNTAKATSDWLFKCSRLDRVASPNPTSLMGPKDESALVGVLRSNRIRKAEDVSNVLRRDWGTDSHDAGSSASASSTTPESCHYRNDPCRPIEKALKDYRVAFQQRASRRGDKQAKEVSWYNYQTTDVDFSGSSSACSQYGALPLGVNATKKVTWVDWPCYEETERVVVKKVTWSGWVQVYEIENGHVR